MVHLEIFWRDPTIEPKAPETEPTMEIFSDWGVAIVAKENSLFAIKSGAIGGRAMHEVILKKSFRKNPQKI